MVRHPAVAGQFYPADPSALRRMIEAYLEPGRQRLARAAICPHAGYIYSGPVAGAVYSRLVIPEDVVIIGPNHHGLGEPAALMAEGRWEMPFGPVEINSSLAELLLEESQVVADDPRAHLYEHSLEVQVPFIQYLRPEVKIVPLCLSWLHYPECEEIGLAVARAIKAWAQPVLIVASTDMTHYESQEIAKAKDGLAVEKILALDPRGLLETVAANRISMCGVIPTTVALIAAKALGARKAELIRYATSGDITGDYAQVVGYAGLIVE